MLYFLLVVAVLTQSSCAPQLAGLRLALWVFGAVLWCLAAGAKMSETK